MDLNFSFLLNFIFEFFPSSISFQLKFPSRSIWKSVSKKGKNFSTFEVKEAPVCEIFFPYCSTFRGACSRFRRNLISNTVFIQTFQGVMFLCDKLIGNGLNFAYPYIMVGMGMPSLDGVWPVCFWQVVC